MIDYDWLVIGGGPHGRYAARAIIDAAPDCRLAVIDPLDGLAAWQRRASACGMAYLRSSNAHHLGQRADSLRRFARAHDYDARHFLGYYRRPSRALFEAHAVASTGAVAQIRARVVNIAAHGSRWQVSTDDGRTHVTDRLVVATGPNPPRRPSGLEAAEHVFDDDFELGEPGRATVIVGGGITGAQLVLRAVEAGHRICWLTRGPPRPSDFDADPSYAGPRGMRPFDAAAISDRTKLLAAARRPGTLPPDILARITATLASGSAVWRCGDAIGLEASCVRLADGHTLPAERVILATGFDTALAPDSPLGQLVAHFELAHDDAGHLHLDAALQAAPGLHVIGRPASLLLGPMAGNIKGARVAGARLARVAGAGRSLRAV